MAWLLIVVAGLFETGFAILLKQSANFTRLWPTVGFAACALISFGLLTRALGRLEVGPAYASHNQRDNGASSRASTRTG